MWINLGFGIDLNALKAVKDLEVHDSLLPNYLGLIMEKVAALKGEVSKPKETKRRLAAAMRGQVSKPKETKKRLATGKSGFVMWFIPLVLGM